MLLNVILKCTMYAHSSEFKVSQSSGSYAASEIKTPGGLM